MKRWILGFALGVGAAPTAALAQTNCISFSQDTAVLAGVATDCGPHVNPVDPGPGEAYAIRFALPKGQAARGWVYYTTDASAPGGAGGQGAETTKVAAAAATCGFDDGTLNGKQEVFQASIPASDSGTRVRFILSAEADGGAESFLATPADGGTQCSASTSDLARVFEYTVSAADPKPVEDVIMVAMDTRRAVAAPGLMANDRFVTASTTPNLDTEGTAGDLTVESDGSLIYVPPPGFHGEDSFNYQLQVTSREYGSNWVTVRLLVRPPNALVSIVDEPSGAHCSAGGKRIDVGIDNGAGDTTPFDGKLDPPEVTGTSYACNGAPGAQGSAGGPAAIALVKTTAESGGANCAKGGQKVEAGVDANGNGALDPSEVTSTAYVCTGATGKSGCSAAPGELSGLLGLASLAWLGLRRRGSEKEGGR